MGPPTTVRAQSPSKRGAPGCPADAIEMVQGSNEKLALGDGRRCIAFFGQRILRDQFELGTRFDNKRIAVVIRKVKILARTDRRGAMVPAQMFHPEAMTRMGVQAARKAAIGNEKEIRTMADWRRDITRAARIAP